MKWIFDYKNGNNEKEDCTFKMLVFSKNSKIPCVFWFSWVRNLSKKSMFLTNSHNSTNNQKIFFHFHSTEFPNLKGVGQMMEVWVSGSNGGEFVVVVGDIFGDVA